METLIGEIYSLFESLYGQYLGEHLWGYDCQTQVYTRNSFNPIGFITFLVSFTFVIAYYYLPFKFFNHPRSNRWWNWLIILFIASLLNCFVAYGWTINDLLNGNIGDCLMHTRGPNGNIISVNITQRECWLFGLTNSIISGILFIFGSLIFKWRSRNCKYTPI